MKRATSPYIDPLANSLAAADGQNRTFRFFEPSAEIGELELEDGQECTNHVIMYQHLKDHACCSIDCSLSLRTKPRTATTVRPMFQRAKDDCERPGSKREVC